MKYDLRDWQHTARKRWIEAGGRGIAKIVTGGGKTVFAESCIEYALEKWPNLRIFVVVPTTSLADQWAISLVDEGEFAADAVSVFRRGQENDSQFLILVINTARRELAKLNDEATPAMLVVDECHRAGSEINATALDGTYVATLGLSATPERPYDDAFELKIVPRLGNVIYDYGIAAARADGVVSEFELVNVRVPFIPSEKAAYNKVSQQIGHRVKQLKGSTPTERRHDSRLQALLRKRASISNAAVLRIPTTIYLIEQHRSKKCIVFHESVETIEKLQRLARERKQSVTIYHTGIDGNYRRENLRLFRRGVYDILFSCRALDEGMNIPEVEIAVIAGATATQRQRIQRLGRVLRPSDAKEKAIVYTLYSTDVEEERLKAESKQLDGIAKVRWIKAEADYGTNSD